LSKPWAKDFDLTSKSQNNDYFFRGIFKASDLGSDPQFTSSCNNWRMSFKSRPKYFAINWNKSDSCRNTFCRLIDGYGARVYNMDIVRFLRFWVEKSALFEVQVGEQLRYFVLEQACTTYGPRAKYGPRKFSIWPAKPKFIYIWLDFWWKQYKNWKKLNQSGPVMFQQHFFGQPWNLSCASLY